MGLSVSLGEPHPAESIMNNIHDGGVYYYRLGRQGVLKGHSYCYKDEGKAPAYRYIFER